MQKKIFLNIGKKWMNYLTILLTSLQESLELPKDALINQFKYPSH